MLVLTRRVGESLMIGDNVEVVITAINGSQVKIGLVAPKEVNIVRKELLNRKQGE